MDVVDVLRDMAARWVEDDEMPWASESDRWAELVFCLLNAVAEIPLDPDVRAERCRSLTDTLDALELLDPASLAATADPANARHVVLTYVLLQYEFSDDQAKRAVSMLSTAAAAVNETFAGKIQRYLRSQAETIRDDLVSALGGDTVTESELRRGVTHWLQNALNLPLSVDDKYVQEFCDSHAIGLKELENAADEIDFNVALVDDMIRGMAVAARENRESEEPSVPPFAQED